jgi:centromere/kinetochore protein ZW10
VGTTKHLNFLHVHKQTMSTSLTPAILRYVDTGVYPESEVVITTDLQSNALASILAELRKEQHDVKQEIRSLSSKTAPDIDTWISRAKELQVDIQRSRETARQIVVEAEAGKELKVKAQDSGNKVALLEKELSFNEALTGTLEHIRHASGFLNQAQDEAVKGRIRMALEKLTDAESSIGGLQDVEGSRAVGILSTRATALRDSLRDSTIAGWNSLVSASYKEKSITVRNHKVEQPEVTLDSLVAAAPALDVFERLVQKVSRDVDHTLLKPLMSLDSNGNPGKISVNGDSITCGRLDNNDHSATIFSDLQIIIEFLAHKLPTGVCVPLSRFLMPSLTSRLDAYWLEPSIPLDMLRMPSFQTTLNEVQDFVQFLDDFKWENTVELHEWVSNAPRSWLTKRRETVLGDVRNLVFSGLKDTKTVERIETQMVSHADSENAGENDDDWDTAWDEPEEDTGNATARTISTQKPAEDDDDDASAWDTEDLGDGKKINDDGGEDAWGWGDEEGSQKTNSLVVAKKEHTKPNGGDTAAKHVKQEMTLRETYTVTAIPDGILKIIQQVISDAEALAGPEFASSPVTPAAAGLYSLPTLALALYRATAATAYNKLETGNMLVYNDASRLSDQLRAWQATKSPGSRLRLDNDAKALDNTAKRAYGAEMESQRTILRDLLDGAQGFTNCTTEPFKSECEDAIDQTIHRLHEVHRQLQPVLAQSALRQSLGSLLSTTTAKITTDIEDLSDIGDTDSRQLKSLLDRITELKSLFSQQDPNTGELSDMTFIYCPNWLKFQYLAEILESSLADIKYLWNEGELSLEFDAEEVVDLIEALFADSDLRRKLVADIRRKGTR